MLALLRTRRWIGFTVLVVVAIVGFGLLSRWQWHRAEEKRLERVALAEAAARAPQPLGPTQAPPRPWAPVTVSGSYAGPQVVVRKRPLDATNGFWVLAPLRIPSGEVVWVNRGWLPADGPATTTPAIPPTPGGPVEVTGWWRDFEPSDGPSPDLPRGMVATVSPQVLPERGGFDGYVQLASSEPAETELVAVPRETVDEGRNVSYAMQWLLFATVAVVGWFVFLRREAREDSEATHA